MRTTKIEDHIHLIDAETAGIRNFIASYVLKGKQAAIVETGPTSSIPNVLSGLKELQVKLEDVAFVAVSHIHLDHGGGVGTLLKHLPKAKVIVHPRGVSHLANPAKLWQQSKEVLGSITDLYGEPEPVPADRIVSAADGQVFDIGNGVRLQALETLGHASHHLSYYEMLSGGVFPGDAAGIYLNKIGVVVPTTPPPFRMDIALASLNRLIGLKPKALFYSHFGRASEATEKLNAYAQQLELWAGIARKGIRDGEDLKAISRKIVEGDKAISKALEHISVHPILGETVLNESVLGVVDFVRKSVAE
jgi:glyoxylase-like metal-dependent hydrolase (beta-lactamase superfamily II)